MPEAITCAIATAAPGRMEVPYPAAAKAASMVSTRIGVLLIADGSTILPMSLAGLAAASLPAVTLRGFRLAMLHFPNCTRCK